MEIFKVQNIFTFSKERKFVLSENWFMKNISFPSKDRERRLCVLSTAWLVKLTHARTQSSRLVGCAEPQ